MDNISVIENDKKRMIKLIKPIPDSITKYLLDIYIADKEKINIILKLNKTKQDYIIAACNAASRNGNLEMFKFELSDLLHLAVPMHQDDISKLDESILEMSDSFFEDEVDYLLKKYLKEPIQLEFFETYDNYSIKDRELIVKELSKYIRKERAEMIVDADRDAALHIYSSLLMLEKIPSKNDYDNVLFYLVKYFEDPSLTEQNISSAISNFWADLTKSIAERLGMPKNLIPEDEELAITRWFQYLANDEFVKNFPHRAELLIKIEETYHKVHGLLKADFFDTSLEARKVTELVNVIKNLYNQKLDINIVKMLIFSLATFDNISQADIRQLTKIIRSNEDNFEFVELISYIYGTSNDCKKFVFPNPSEKAEGIMGIALMLCEDSLNPLSREEKLRLTESLIKGLISSLYTLQENKTECILACDLIKNALEEINEKNQKFVLPLRDNSKHDKTKKIINFLENVLSQASEIEIGEDVLLKTNETDKVTVETKICQEVKSYC